MYLDLSRILSVWVKRRHLTKAMPLAVNNLGSCPVELNKLLRLNLHHSNLNRILQQIDPRHNTTISWPISIQPLLVQLLPQTGQLSMYSRGCFLNNPLKRRVNHLREVKNVSPKHYHGHSNNQPCTMHNPLTNLYQLNCHRNFACSRTSQTSSVACRSATTARNHLGLSLQLRGQHCANESSVASVKLA
jgi:hypothetical protein